MKQISIFLFLLISFSFFSQKTEILKVMNNQQAAWNKGDIEGYMQGYWKSDSLIFVGSKGPVFGWKKTLENYKRSYSGKEKMGTLIFSDIYIKKLSQKNAFVYGKWRLKRKADEPNGIFTLVFQKFKEGWRIISDHTE